MTWNCNGMGGVGMGEGRYMGEGKGMGGEGMGGEGMGGEGGHGRGGAWERWRGMGEM